jgi:type I restriction enzyme S subunit
MVEWKKLGDVCEVLRGKRLTKSQLSESEGYPVLHGGASPMGYYKDYNRKANTTVVVNTGNAGSVFFYDKPFWSSDACYSLYPNKNILDKFLYLYVYGCEPILKGKIRAGAMPTIDANAIKTLTIPVPSLEEQNRIVGILDTFTDSIENLKQQIAQRRKQYEHYRDQLLDLEGKEGVEMIPLKDVADIGTGSSNTNEGLEKGKYPFYTRGKEVLWKNEYEFDETSIITAGDGVGVGKVFHFVSGKFALHQRAYRIHIKTEEINPRFIFFYMVSNFEKYIKMKSFFAAVTSVRKPMIFNYPIPKCTILIQQRIVSILDTFEASISNLESQLEQRQKQYEYYRNQLLTFE